MISSLSASDFSVIKLLGQGLGAFGTIEEGQQASGAYSYNANIATQQAIAVRNRSAITQFEKQKNLESLVGEQRAQYAGSGVKVDTGSPLDVMTDTLSKGYLDKAISAYNDEIAARAYESEAAMEKYTAKQVKRESLLKAGLGLIGAASEFGGVSKNGYNPSKYANEGVMG